MLMNGEMLRLDPVVSRKGLFLLFKDRTSGRETYGAGRYFESEMPKNGKIVRGLQQSVQLILRVQSLFVVSIPPKANTLITRIEAGVKYRGEH